MGTILNSFHICIKVFLELTGCRRVYGWFGHSTDNLMYKISQNHIGLVAMSFRGEGCVSFCPNQDVRLSFLNGFAGLGRDPGGEQYLLTIKMLSVWLVD